MEILDTFSDTEFCGILLNQKAFLDIDELLDLFLELYLLVLELSEVSLFVLL